MVVAILIKVGDVETEGEYFDETVINLDLFLRVNTEIAAGVRKSHCMQPVTVAV